MKSLLVFAVLAYRRLLSPWKPRCCRFVPSCSAYAVDALQAHGAVRGTWLTLCRLARCHPWCEPGWDPVPAPPPPRE